MSENLSSSVSENATVASLTNLLVQSARLQQENKTMPPEEYTDEIRLQRAKEYARMMTEAYRLFEQLDPDEKKLLFSQLDQKINDIELGYIKKIFENSEYRREILRPHIEALSSETDQGPSAADEEGVTEISEEVLKKILLEQLGHPAFAPQGKTALKQVEEVQAWIGDIYRRYNTLSEQQQKTLPRNDLHQLYQEIEKNIFEKAREEALSELQGILEQENFADVAAKVSAWLTKYKKHTLKGADPGETFLLESRDPNDPSPISDLIATSQWAWALYMANEENPSSELMRAFGSYKEILPRQAPSQKETDYLTNDWLFTRKNKFYKSEAKSEEEKHTSLQTREKRIAFQNDRRNFRATDFLRYIGEELVRRFEKVKEGQAYFHTVAGKGEQDQQNFLLFIINNEQGEIFYGDITGHSETLPQKSGYYPTTPDPQGWFKGRRWQRE